MNNENIFKEMLDSYKPQASYDAFFEYYMKLLLIKPAYIRKGQTLMILVSLHNTELNKQLTATKDDCFFNDKLIDNTLNYIKTNWNIDENKN